MNDPEIPGIGTVCGLFGIPLFAIILEILVRKYG